MANAGIRSASKTLLLFAVRDHKVSPMDSLEAILREDMARIYSELSKVR